MAQQFDGLSILQGRREQQSNRGAPPPRHPRRVSVATSDTDSAAEPSPVIDLTSDQAEDDSEAQPVLEPQRADEPSKPKISPRSDPARRRSSVRKPIPERTPASATTGLRAAQFYVDDRCDDYLRDIRVEALVRKLDVSGSAVVRLALHRLMEELSPAQVADRLATPTAERSGSGRKRH
jgi:hypothetical protein